MAANPLKSFFLKPFEKVCWLAQRRTLFDCRGKHRNWKQETPVRFFSQSQEHVVKSTYPPIELPEMPFHEYIFEHLGRWENKIAVECGATGKKLKYKELYRYSRTLAGSLQKKFDMKKGDRQAVVLPNCPEYAAIFLAGSMAGVVSSTVNPMYTSTELSLQLKIVRPKILFTASETHSKCLEALQLINLNIPIITVKTHPEQEIPSGCVSYSELAESTTVDCFNPVSCDSNDDLVIPFSSGTSGFPKGVQLAHRNIIANLAQFSSGNYLKSNPNKELNQSIILGVLPMFHIYGMVIVTFDALRCGALLVTLPKFEPKLFVETIFTKKTEILYLAPPLVFFLTQPMVEQQHLKHVQHVVSGAAPCGGSDVVKLLKKCPTLDVCQGYGMTETSPVVAMTHNERFHKTASVGHPLSMTEIKVVDVENGKSLPKGSHGEICVKGPQVMKGYLDNPEETEKIFDENGWLRTGDIGYYDEDDDFFIVDRLKELIKVKGFQVAPAELEEVLRSHPKIADVGVIGVKHREFGEVPKAFVVLKNGVSVTEDEVKDFIKEKLSSNKQLRGGVQFMKAIPKSSAGKILRKELRAMEEKS